jgi:hypothetical protein
MQNGGDHAFVIHAHFRKNFGDGDRVENIGFAGFPGLPFMGLRTYVEGAQDESDFLRFKIGIQQVPKIQDGLRISHRFLHLDTCPEKQSEREVVFLYVKVESFGGFNFRLQHVDPFGSDVAVRNFPQGHYGWLVVLFFYQRLRTIGDLSGTLGGGQDKFKTIIYVLKAIFYCNTSHLLNSPSIWF